ADIDDTVPGMRHQEVCESGMMAFPCRAESGGVASLIDMVQGRQRADLRRTAATTLPPRHGRAFIASAWRGHAALEYRIIGNAQKLAEVMGAANDAGIPNNHCQSHEQRESSH